MVLLFRFCIYYFILAWLQFMRCAAASRPRPVRSEIYKIDKQTANNTRQ